MSTILRIEHEQTLHGPFSKQNPDRDRLSEHTLATELPEAYGDVIAFDCGRHICGLESPATLTRWFGPFLQQLHEARFILVAYEVPAAKVLPSRSGQQVAFDRHDATPTHVFSLLDLMN